MSNKSKTKYPSKPNKKPANAERKTFAFIYPTSLCFIILYHRIKVNVFKNLVLMEHGCMGPKLTQAEGLILGVGAKMFTIAGPVIVYGVSASVVYGLIYWITTLF
ncbi:MAG: SpoVA/SpoVAEb family sporulation membrane protein [Oscillospiraceae bacterium]|nr:SpoVA/SpoVAEb family sporulation membrane protein [Oscillospiraceae bacterium]